MLTGLHYAERLGKGNHECLGESPIPIFHTPASRNA